MNFKYALSLASMLYDVEGDEQDLEEIGLVAYNFIGNKNTELKKTMLSVVNGKVQLPCGVSRIEAVTYCGPEDWNYTSNTKEYGDLNSLYTEQYIERNKLFTDPHYLSGRFVKYKKVGDTLYVDNSLGKVIVLYHSEILDNDGLPEINDKEAIAIAEYIAYVIKYKEAIKTNNQYILKSAQDLRRQWLFHYDAARTPESISQNEMDAILNAQSSWGRKVYNKSFKPIM